MCQVLCYATIFTFSVFNFAFCILFKKMSSGSVKKMSETAMANKKGFAEILDFAKEAM